MGVLAFAALLFLAMACQSSANWCVCKTGMSDAMLQNTLDYACGAGADCNPIESNGSCYSPNTVKAHCDYAVNSYFQKNGQAQGSCDFAGTATPVVSDPSIPSCVYPSSASTAGSTTPESTTPTTGTTPTATETTAHTTGTTPTTTDTTGTTPTTPETTTYTTGTTPTTPETTTYTTGTTPTTPETTTYTTGTTPTTPESTTPPTTCTIMPMPWLCGREPSEDCFYDSGVIRLIDTTSLFSSFTTLFFSGLMLWWG